ncbi:MAG TPA: hypothetical protein VLS96_06565 [Nodosilinea sp.]|nr:hypothetical protein [Nodosilinea sp.]
MGRKILHYRNLRYPLRRWLALALLTALVVVQLSPLGAAATGPQRSAMPPTAPLLSQLEALPGGAIALPNFDPAVNGFQFSNQELIDAIDLERNAAAWEEVLSEQLMQLFGSQVCVGGESATCVLTSAAQRWLRTQLSRMDQGLSEGMAAAALDLWQPTPPRLPWWQRLVNVLLGRTVFGLARTLFDLQTFIANLFLMQGVTEVSQPTQAVRDTFTPTQILLAIARVFLTGSGDPFTLGVYRLLEGAVGEGHSLTPYRVEDRGRGQYWVYVYDSNYPAGRPTSPPDLHVEFDTQADTWRYQPIANGPEFKGDAQSKTLDLTQKSWRQPPPAPQSQSAPQTQPATTGPFTCPFCRIEPEGEPEGEPETGITPALAPTLDITLVGEGQLTVRPYSSAVDPGAADPLPWAPLPWVPLLPPLTGDGPRPWPLGLWCPSKAGSTERCPPAIVCPSRAGASPWRSPSLAELLSQRLPPPYSSPGRGIPPPWRASASPPGKP